jgi:peptidyl-prolyl cis-trans isomerase A (cyclophilin A)
MKISGMRILPLLLLVAFSAQTQTRPPSHTPARQIDPTGPTAVIDTSAGRFTCRLYTQQAPITAANFIALAEGAKDWTDSSGASQHNKPFYDGLQIFGMSDGVASGDRASLHLGFAGPDTSPEKTGLDFSRAGRLVAMTASGKQTTGFAITDHPDIEWARRGIVFGQCDDVSIELSANVTHELLSTDNHPEHPVVVRSIRIVASGQPLPPPAEPIPGEADLHVPPPAPLLVPAPEPTGPVATIETTLGTITCRLFDKEAPVATANFIGLATGTKPYKNAAHAQVRGRRFYDGLTFGRVIPDFMIQNADSPGDPNGGGAGYEFGNEVVPGLSFDRPGRLAYANAGPNTNSSEFFITRHAVRRLDGNFTIFGQCDDASIPVVEAIAQSPRDEKNKPLRPVVIRHITIASAKP